MDLSQGEETKDRGGNQDLEVVPEIPQTQATREPEMDEVEQEEVKVEEIQFNIT